MRKVLLATATAATLLGLTACGGGGGAGVFGRDRPDEFAVSRQAPLVVPPDFALVPPRPGAPRPQEADSSTQALQAMFGGQQQRSATEGAVISGANPAAAQPGVRSSAGDPATTVVDKGSTTQEIVNAPAQSGTDATVTTPQ